MAGEVFRIDKRVSFLGPTEPRPVMPISTTPQAQLSLLCKTVLHGSPEDARALAAKLVAPKPEGSAVLQFLLAEGSQWAVIYGDSRLVVDQLSNRIKAKHGVYLPHSHGARQLLEKLPEVRLKWISRNLNIEADGLAAKALPTA